MNIYLSFKRIKMKSTEEIFQTVINKNTFYYFNKVFEDKYEDYITSNKENGLRAILALTGFSNEYLKRIITLIRVVNNPELNNLVMKENWERDEKIDDLSEWSDTKIQSLIKKNKFFRQGIVNLFYEGSSVKFLAEMIFLLE